MRGINSKYINDLAKRLQEEEDIEIRKGMRYCINLLDFAGYYFDDEDITSIVYDRDKKTIRIKEADIDYLNDKLNLIWRIYKDKFYMGMMEALYILGFDVSVYYDASNDYVEHNIEGNGVRNWQI